MTIHKYPLRLSDEDTLLMPKGAKILCVQVKHTEPHIWAEVDPNAPMEPRKILVVGTGWELGDTSKLRYIDTYQMQNGYLVFHVFEQLT